jgi:hypothetical protein
MQPANFPAFRFVSVSRPGPTALAVRWALKPHAWPVEDLGFVVFRSMSPKGPWEELDPVTVGQLDYTDFSVVGTLTRTYYYIVRAVSLSGKGFVDSEPSWLVHDPDHVAVEMVRKKQLFLLHRGGIEAAVLPVRTWGPRCSRCYNEQRMRAEDDNCAECFGTGFTGGFLNPVNVPALFHLPERTVVQAGIPFEPIKVYAELANYPVLHPDDIVVDRTMNVRYLVEHIRTTSHRGYPISQIVQLNRLSDSDVIYEIPITQPTQAHYGRSFDTLERGQREDLPRPSDLF